MCRRAQAGNGGKRHFACFPCRKSYKQPGSSEWGMTGEARPFPCPGCGKLMRDLGSDFKAPRQRDVRRWLTVEILDGLGIGYHPGCCDGPGYRPAELTQVEQFLVARGYSTEAIRKRIRAVKRRRSASLT